MKFHHWKQIICDCQRPDLTARAIWDPDSMAEMVANTITPTQLELKPQALNEMEEHWIEGPVQVNRRRKPVTLPIKHHGTTVHYKRRVAYVGNCRECGRHFEEFPEDWREERKQFFPSGSLDHHKDLIKQHAEQMRKAKAKYG